jgi:cytochrome c-type biogenesis protein CcmE
MKIKYTYLIVGALIVVSIILAYDAFTSYINPYLSVSDIAENNAEYVNMEEIKVLGTAVNGSSGWAEDGSFLFNLTDGQSTIKVTSKSRPEIFVEGEQVLVEGKLVSPYHLNASEIFFTCKSEYEGGETSLLSNPVFLIAIIIGSAALVYYVVFMILKKS